MAFPRPVDGVTPPYRLDAFLDDLRRALQEYADTDGRVGACASDDGTCYWIRADMDSGTMFLRVFTKESDEGRFDVEECPQDDVPGRIRLN